MKQKVRATVPTATAVASHWSHTAVHCSLARQYDNRNSRHHSTLHGVDAARGLDSLLYHFHPRTLSI